MEKFIQHTGWVIPLDVSNVDTDAIIPKQFLQKVTRTGFGYHLFHDWRFLDDAGRNKNYDFILNKECYKKSSILLTRDNFGCGSSREHAPWALIDYGFKVVIAESFSDIFYSNAFNNQLLLITLCEQDIEKLFEIAMKKKWIKCTVDLYNKNFHFNGEIYSFEIDSFRINCIINSIDTISLTLKNEYYITCYEEKKNGL